MINNDDYYYYKAGEEHSCDCLGAITPKKKKLLPILQGSIHVKFDTHFEISGSPEGVKSRKKGWLWEILKL